MNLNKLIGFICAVAFTALAGFNTVTVPPAMVHWQDVGTATGSGKIEYTVTAGDTDSVFVTLTITAQDGTPLPLSETAGDTGKIRIVNPLVAEKHSIYFTTQTPPNPGVHYVAHLVATAVVSGEKTQVEGFLKSMSKNDRAGMMGGCCDNFTATAGGTTIPVIIMSDGPHGVRPQSGAAATLYPCCSGEACTWDTALAFIQGASKGEEFRALGKNCSLGPALDLVYHPQGGRASEYYGEDPYESGNMASKDCAGLQSKGVVATIKHYACNNKEDNRQTLSANMSERSLQELYLYNWKPCVMSGSDGCWGVMGAYNQINHLLPNQGWACQNKYTETDVLRNQWGYKYLAMTDWGANMDFTPAMNFGVDIDMPNPDTYTPGTVSQQADSLINQHVRRIIYTHERLGDLVSGYNATAFASTFKGTDHQNVARQVGTAGLVLGFNDTMAQYPTGTPTVTGRVLPLPKSGAKIALTGPFASTCRLGPGGSSLVNPALSVNPKNAISNLLGGLGVYLGQKPANASTIVTDITTADYIVVFVGVTGETEGADRPSLAIVATDGGDNDVASALAVKTAKTIVVYTGGSAATPGNWSKASAIVFAFYPGEEQGYCIADVLFGNVNPSGKLPVTFPNAASQLPNFTLGGNVELNYPSSDTAHGYFRMDKNNWTPLFHFGHGLSYTAFDYSGLQVYPSTIQAGDRVHVQVTVKNIGHVAGKETAELYLSMPSGAAGLPVRVQDLRGFQKVPLDPTKTLDTNATANVSFTLYPEDMQVYNPNGADYSGNGAWQILPGTYTVRVGTSSDVNQQPSVSGTFTVTQ